MTRMAPVWVVGHQQPQNQYLSSRCRQRAPEQWNDIGESKQRLLRVRIHDKGRDQILETMNIPILTQETTDTTRVTDAHQIQLLILWYGGTDGPEVTPRDLIRMTSKSYLIGSTPVADHYMDGPPVRTDGPHEGVPSVGSPNAKEDGM